MTVRTFFPQIRFHNHVLRITCWSPDPSLDGFKLSYMFPRIFTGEGSAGFKIGLIMSLGHFIHMTAEYRRDEAIVTNRENFLLLLH